jgi:hypothetical protein
VEGLVAPPTVTVVVEKVISWRMSTVGVFTSTTVFSGGSTVVTENDDVAGSYWAVRLTRQDD